MKIKRCVTVTLAAAIAAVCVSCVVPYADLSSIDFLVATPRREVFPTGYSNWNPADPYDGVAVTAVDNQGTSRDIPASDVRVTFPDYPSAAQAFSAEGSKRVLVSYLGKSAAFTLYVSDGGIGGAGGGGGGGGGGPTIIINPQ